MKWKKGKTVLKWLPKKASTVFAEDSLVYFDGSGEIQPADSTSGDHVGIIRVAVAATDDDYASNTKVPVEVPLSPQCEFEADATGLTQDLEGTAVDLTDASTVNGSATAKGVVTLVKFISATKGRFVLNSQYAYKNVTTT